MNILILNKLLKPDTGGVEEVVEQHRRILSKEHRVTSWGAQYRPNEKTKVQDDEFGRCVRYRSLFRILSMPISLTMLYDYFKKSSRYDVVIVHLPYPIGVLACLLNPPKNLVVVWHSDLVRPAKLKPIMRWLDSKLLKRARKIITTSERLAEHSDTLSSDLANLCIIPIHTPDVITTQAKPKELSNNCNDFYLFLGRLSYYKGIEVLLEAAQQYQGKKQIIIAGTGEFNLANSSLIHSKNVTFINRIITDEEKAWLMSNCRALIFPSTQRSEAFGIVQLEAMIHSKPVINTDLESGVPFVARHLEEGITITPNNSNELSQALASLDDDALWKRLGQNAKERAATTFGKYSVSSKLLGMVQQIEKNF
jgi:rhamnosyl/mannosyltransferase